MKFNLFTRQKPALPNITLPYTQEVSRQQKKFLLTFLLFLLFTSIYTYFYVKDKIAEKELIKVYTASNNLKAPHVLQAIDLKVTWYPKKLLPASVPAYEDLLNQTLMDSVVANELILAHNIQKDIDNESIASSDLFKRGVAINIDEEWLVSPIPKLKPNDTISIIATNPFVSNSVKKEEPNEPNKIIVNQAKVLSVDEKELVINLTEMEISALMLSKSLELPMQIIIFPNKQDVTPITKNTSAELVAIESQNKPELELNLTVPDNDTKNNNVIVAVNKGETNEKVKILQNFLISQGLDMKATGYYGDWTETCVKNWQKKMGLKETGLTDTDTLKKMNEENLNK